MNELDKVTSSAPPHSHSQMHADTIMAMVTVPSVRPGSFPLLMVLLSVSLMTPVMLLLMKTITTTATTMMISFAFPPILTFLRLLRSFSLPSHGRASSRSSHIMAMVVLSSMSISAMPTNADIECPSNCSTLSPLPYPFGAKPGCGSPGFQITDCSIDTPLWDLTLAGSRHAYYIKDIGSNPNHSNLNPGPILSYGYGGTVRLLINTTDAPALCEFRPTALGIFTTSNFYAFEDADLTFYEDHYLFFNCTMPVDNRPDSGVLTPSSPLCTKYMNYCNFSSNGGACLDYVPDKELLLNSLMTTYNCGSLRRYIIADVDAPVSTWVSAVQFAWGPVRDADSCASCQISGGECGYNVQDESSFQCYCKDGTHRANCHKGSGKYTAIAVGVSVALLFIFIFGGVVWYYRHKYFHYILFHKHIKIDGVNQAPLELTYGTVAAATKSFSMKVGQGAFGKVYRGLLPDGSDIAVKVLDHSMLYADQQFMNEVATIGNIHHVNVARLVGFCFQRSKRILVYEYISNGSLEKYIFSSKRSSSQVVLSWKQRFDIAIGIARGLSYMHEECRNCIIHCDIKPQNILLDAAFCPKISDFGLARLLTREESRILTQARGTPGYMAPEFWSLGSGPLTPKFDVYSYGVVLLEMIGGKRCFDMLDEVLQEEYEDTWISVSIDEKIEDEADVEQVKRCTSVACWCIQDNPALRPTMSKVVQYLQGTSPVPKNPPKPFRKMYQNEDSRQLQSSSLSFPSNRTPGSNV